MCCHNVTHIEVSDIYRSRAINKYHLRCYSSRPSDLDGLSSPIWPLFNVKLNLFTLTQTAEAFSLYASLQVSKKTTVKVITLTANRQSAGQLLIALVTKKLLIVEEYHELPLLLEGGLDLVTIA